MDSFDTSCMANVMVSKLPEKESGCHFDLDLWIYFDSDGVFNVRWTVGLDQGTPDNPSYWGRRMQFKPIVSLQLPFHFEDYINFPRYNLILQAVTEPRRMTSDNLVTRVQVWNWGTVDAANVVVTMFNSTSSKPPGSTAPDNSTTLARVTIPLIAAHTYVMAELPWRNPQQPTIFWIVLSSTSDVAFYHVQGWSTWPMSTLLAHGGTPQLKRSMSASRHLLGDESVRFDAIDFQLAQACTA